jgi:hypothetical protein
MKLKITLIAIVCAASVWLLRPQQSEGQQTSYEVMATMYTCEAHPRNPMHPCGQPRWGGSIHSPGMACPPEWRNRLMVVPGYGTRRCDDTAARPTLRGLPHIDIRVPSYNQAINFGVRRMTIYPAGQTASAAPAPTQRPAPTATRVPVATPVPVVTQAPPVVQPVAPPEEVIAVAADGAGVAVAAQEEVVVAAAAPVSPAAVSVVLPAPQSAISTAHARAPYGDAQTALARLVRAETAQARFGGVVSWLNLPPTHPVWVVTLWVPPQQVPEGTVAMPDASAEVAARFFAFNALTGELLVDTFVTPGVVETMGWLAWDASLPQ